MLWETAWKTTYLPAMRCPVFRRRDSNWAFENLTGDAKRKGTSGGPVRRSIEAPATGGMLRSSVEPE